MPVLHGSANDMFVKVRGLAHNNSAILGSIHVMFCFQCFVDGNDSHQSTDTHWRCSNGKGSWNWRLKIPLELPVKTRELGRLRIEVNLSIVMLFGCDCPH